MNISSNTYTLSLAQNRNQEAKQYLQEVKNGAVEPTDSYQLSPQSAASQDLSLSLQFRRYEAKDNSPADQNREPGAIDLPVTITGEESVKAEFSGDTTLGVLRDEKDSPKSDRFRDVTFSETGVDCYDLRRDDKTGQMTIRHLHVDRTGGECSYVENFPRRY
jgi:hypothetical protein